LDNGCGTRLWAIEFWKGVGFAGALDSQIKGEKKEESDNYSYREFKPEPCLTVAVLSCIL